MVVILNNLFCPGVLMNFTIRTKSKSVIALAMMMSISGAAQATPAELAAMQTSDFLLGTAGTGCQPKGLRSDAKGEFAYVAEMCGKKVNNVRVATVTIFNLKTLKLEKTIITPSGPTKGILGNTEVSFTLDQDYVLAARAEGPAIGGVYPGQGMITVIQTDQQAIKEFIPVRGTGSKIIEMRPYVTSEGKRQLVYVANYFSDDISVLDVTGVGADTTTNNDKRFIKKIKLHSMFRKKTSGASQIAPRGIAFTPDGRYALVDASETGSIFVVDAVNHRQLAELAPIPVDLGSVPLRQQFYGDKSMNVRHVIMTKDGSMVYLSHMRGDKISRISVPKLIAKALSLNALGQSVIPSEFWHDLIVPFANGKQLISVQHYPKDHPQFSNRDWDMARPNTIVLDPVNERYLYVSCRTDTNPDYRIYDARTKGKVDIIDTKTGEEIFTLVGGSQPTALEATPDNRLLISGGFKDDKLYFFDLKKLISIYEN